MNGDESESRQRTVMASDAEREVAGRLADELGMNRSRYLMHRTLMPDAIPAKVLRRGGRADRPRAQSFFLLGVRRVGKNN